jgi:Rrf2 family protein
VFSNPCKYALQALVHLAGREGGGPALLRDVAEAEGIPPSFLAKIMQQLARKGLLRSAKGPGGGFTLNRPAGKVSVREVVEAVDGLDAVELCCMRLEACDSDSPCPLHEAWKEVQERIVLLLEGTTLEDLARGGPKATLLQQLKSSS